MFPHLLCNQGVAGSIPATSTNLLFYNLCCFLFLSCVSYVFELLLA